MPLYRVYGVLKSDGSEVIEEVVSPSREEAEAHVNRRDVFIERIELLDDMAAKSVEQPIDFENSARVAGEVEKDEGEAVAGIEYLSGKPSEAVKLAIKARKLIGRGRTLWHWFVFVCFFFVTVCVLLYSVFLFILINEVSTKHALLVSITFLMISSLVLAFFYVLDCILIGILIYFEARCVQIISGGDRA